LVGNQNPRAFRLLEPKLKEWLNMGNLDDEIGWDSLSMSPYALPLLEKYPENIDWEMLDVNPNPGVSRLLEKYPKKVKLGDFAGSSHIFELDLDALKEHCAIFKEELIQRAMHPSRIHRWLEMGYEIEELDI
jgi:hypothetical protein